MQSDTSGWAVPVATHPILRILIAFPIACFCGALVTDIVYASTADMIWADFSAWLLAIGILAGVLAAIGGIVALVTGPRGSRSRPVLRIALGSILVLIVALFDNLVHSRDAWTSVVPMGLILSAATAGLTLATVWVGSGYARRGGMPSQGVL